MRGWDATGVFGIDKQSNLDIKKQAAAAGHFCMTKQFEDFKKKIVSDYQIIVGHNRKATHGEKKNEDAHPFWDAEEKICLVHNGMISNHKDFCKDATVDSAAIANALAKDSIETVIENISGAFAFIWYNIEEKVLYFIRNSSRPLFIVETGTTFVLGSEAQMVQWICNRNESKIENIKLIPEDTLFSFSFDKREIKQEKEIKPKKKSTLITTIPVTTGHVTTELYEVALDSLYITTLDVNTADKVMKTINRKDELNVEFMSYEDAGKDSYKVFCQLINTNAPHITILMWVTKALFDILELNKIHTVSVLSLSRKDDRVIIYVNNPEECDYCETQNEILITTAMWFDDRFPNVCDVCADNVKWNDIKNSQVLLMDQDVISVVCPKCSAKKG